MLSTDAALFISHLKLFRSSIVRLKESPLKILAQGRVTINYSVHYTPESCRAMQSANDCENYCLGHHCVC